jgi:phosphate transport system substrate-binding protein
MHKLWLKIIVLSAFTLPLVWGNPSHSYDKPNLIRIKGSDTLAKVAKAWGKAYTRQHSGAIIKVASGGSGNGIAGLINGHVDIASTSRKLRKREKRLISKKSDKKPFAIIVGLDAVSVLVHNNNPLNGISLTQLADIYGKPSKINKWSDIGVTIPGCKTDEIKRISRKNNSGTYAFFRNTIFGKRAHFNSALITLSNSESVVDHVSKHPCAIGYSGMSFLNNSVKTLCISKTTSKQGCIPPTATFTLNHQYPLSRPLFMYTLGEPKGETRDFLTWVRGKEGQHILRKAGFVSPPNK